MGKDASRLISEAAGVFHRVNMLICEVASAVTCREQLFSDAVVFLNYRDAQTDYSYYHLKNKAALGCLRLFLISEPDS